MDGEDRCPLPGDCILDLAIRAPDESASSLDPSLSGADIAGVGDQRTRAGQQRCGGEPRKEPCFPGTSWPRGWVEIGNARGFRGHSRLRPRPKARALRGEDRLRPATSNRSASSACGSGCIWPTELAVRGQGHPGAMHRIRKRARRIECGDPPQRRGRAVCRQAFRRLCALARLALGVTPTLEPVLVYALRRRDALQSINPGAPRGIASVRRTAPAPGPPPQLRLIGGLILRDSGRALIHPLGSSRDGPGDSVKTGPRRAGAWR